MDTAKLFTNGGSQAVRLPKEYRFEGTEVFIKKVGQAIVLIPYHEATSVSYTHLTLPTNREV